MGSSFVGVVATPPKPLACGESCEAEGGLTLGF